MKRKRFSVEQIVTIVKQAEMGMPVAELIRRVGISEQTVSDFSHSSLKIVRRGMERSRMSTSEADSLDQNIVTGLATSGGEFIPEFLHSRSPCLFDGCNRCLRELLLPAADLGVAHKANILAAFLGVTPTRKHTAPTPTALQFRIRSQFFSAASVIRHHRNR